MDKVTSFVLGKPVFVEVDNHPSKLVELESIYNAGRWLRDSDKFNSDNVTGENIWLEGENPGPNGIPEDEKATVKTNIYRLVEEIETDISLEFMELSVFDPEGPGSDVFYFTLMGKNRAFIKAYVKSMRLNLDSEGNSDEDRGLLVPNHNLYGHPIIAQPLKRSIRCDSDGKTTIYLGLFPGDMPSHAISSEGRQRVRGKALSFMRDVLDKIDDENGNGEIDIAILITFPRPAGIATSDNEPINLSGGALFLYGKRKDNFAIHEFVLRIQHLLTRSVMQDSNTHIETLKTLDDQRKTEYATQAHEIKNLLPMISSAPLLLRNEVEMYFRTLFAVSGAEIERVMAEDPKVGYYPNEFAQGENFREFISNAAVVSARIQAAIDIYSNRDPHDPWDEENLYEQLQEGVNVYFSRVTFNSMETQIIDFSQEDGDTYSRWFFFGAMVCLFRNVFKHASVDRDITVSVDDGEEVFQVVNSTDRAPGATSDNGERKWPGSTRTAIQYYAQRYKSDPKQANYFLLPECDTDEYIVYMSQLPLPPKWINKDILK